MTRINPSNSKQRGFTLISMAIWIIVLFGLLGLSVDAGRLFINKAEIQTFTDSSALTAARYLDGTTAGITNARGAVTGSSQKWNFDTQTPSNIEVEFATASDPDNWQANPGTGTNYTRVRVTASPVQALFFMPVITGNMSQVVRARSVAQQAKITKMYEGAFPFAPMSLSPVGPHFGLVPGTEYTLRYPSSDKKDACVGDQDSPLHYSVGPNRGFWGDSSSTVIGARIENDFQAGAVLTIGDYLPAEGGAKTTIVTYLDNRVMQDTDRSSTAYADYAAGGNGNGRRVVIMPIQDESTSVVLGLGMFFLKNQGAYSHSGNRPWCAEYVGKAALPNSGVSGSSTSAGAYQIKLVQ